MTALVQSLIEVGSVAGSFRPGCVRVTTAAQNQYLALPLGQDRFRTSAETNRITPGVQNERIGKITCNYACAVQIYRLENHDDTTL